MGGLRQLAPAFFRRAFLLVAACGAVVALAGPPSGSPPPPLAQVGKPDAAESARILARFRNSGWRGYIEFDLHALPRRGDEVVYHGRLWGGLNDQGPITRVELTDAHGGVHRFLLQNGARAAVWRLTDGAVARIDGSALLDPLIPGVEVTAFDLQMPYLYWPDARVTQVTRVRGRPAYAFVFNPPDDFAKRYPQIAAVRSYFDAQYSAPVQTELLDPKQIVKTTSLDDLKKVGEQWIPKSFDVRNEITRDKTRFEVTAVALNLVFADPVFAPAALTENIAPPSADRITRLDQ